MKETIKYIHIAVLFFSLLAMVWSFRVIKENHTNYGELVESYGNLVKVYEEQFNTSTIRTDAAARIEFLKSDIDLRVLEGQESSVKPSLGYYYMWFVLGLIGIGVAGKMQTKIDSGLKKSVSKNSIA